MQESTSEEIWFYSKGGVRSGPFSQQKLISLQQSGEIGPKTLCWCKDYGNEWRPLSETGILREAQASNLPPPLPTHAINNAYAWLYALTPIGGSFILKLFRVESFPAGLLLYMLFYLAFISLDSRLLVKSGHPSPPSRAWVFLAPGYLWKRSNILGQNKLLFWIMIAMIILSSLLEQQLAGESFFDGISMTFPTCDGSLSNGKIKELFDDINKRSGTGVTALYSANVNEIVFANDRRSCSAVINASDAQRYDVTFDVSIEQSQYYYTLHVNSVEGR